jgi:3-oxo-4,17-pregnadiene-20-carboxyl-CoA hydratase alpha subunit
MTMVETSYLERARALVGVFSESWVARLPVNEAMIRNWCEALGDTAPAWGLAPPAMLNVWTMRGREPFGGGDPQKTVTNFLDDAGYTGVLATNYEQTYARYLKPGETITAVRHIGAVSDEKSTGLGPGHFVDIMTTFRDSSGEVVGTQLMRILKYRPETRAVGKRPKPAINDDTQFFWDACARGELVIQRCASCGVLRHPPRPGCGACGSLEWDTVTASGRGSVYSYVVHHYPPVPGFEVPYVVALVALAEGTRIVANLDGVAPGAVKIGMPVTVSFVKVDGELTVPAFRPAGDA